MVDWKQVEQFAKGASTALLWVLLGVLVAVTVGQYQGEIEIQVGPEGSSLRVDGGVCDRPPLP